MFKKTLAAVAVLGAFAGAATAANVTLYGLVDEALQYKYEKVGDEKADTYGLKAGASAGNRFGLKGTEELGNGYTVGFVLENGFTADDGKLGQGSRLFGRAATAYVTGPFGTLAAGHDGALASGLGTVSYIYQYAALGTGWGDVVGSQGLYNFSYKDRADNAVTYVSPDLGGLKLYAQYSFEANGQEKASANDNNRYAALGAQYIAGAFSTGLVVDMIKPAEGDADVKDPFHVSYGASYDFGAAKVYGMAQWGKHMTDVGYKLFEYQDKSTDDKKSGLFGDVEGWNLSLGVSAPLGGGTAYAQVNYVDVKSKADAVLGSTVTKEVAEGTKYKGYGLGLAYSYPLSKRTAVFTYGGWNQLKYKDSEDSEKVKIGEVGLGLVHKF